MLATELTEEVLHRLSKIERVSSAFSFMGIVFMISAFFLSNDFRKPLHRVMLYATAGNIFTCIGTVISRDAMEGDTVVSPILCKFQAFLIQMFFLANVFWAFCMALNVYCTFYYRYSAAQLMALEKWYIAFCYGPTFIVAFVLLFVKTDKRGEMYGNAILWCSISNNWIRFRMYLQHFPTWFISLGTIFIYIRLLYTVVANYISISGFSRKADPPLPVYNAPFTGRKTTRISVLSEHIVVQSAVPLKDMPSHNGEYTSRSYSWEVTSGEGIAGPTVPSNVGTGSTSRNPFAHAQPAVSQRNRNAGKADQALKAMVTVSLAFFLILLGTWLPSTANRIYSLGHLGHVNVALQYATAAALPLQGFLNCVVFILISRDALKVHAKNLMKNLKEGRLRSATIVRENIHDAFPDSSTIGRQNSSRNLTPFSRNSRLFAPRVNRSQDDSITLLDFLGPPFPTSSRQNTTRSDDLDSV